MKKKVWDGSSAIVFVDFVFRKVKLPDHENISQSLTQKKKSLCVWAELFAQANLDRSITVLPKKELRAKRRDYFSKTELVGSHLFVRRTCAGTEPTQPTQEPTQASLAAEGIVW